MSSRGKEGKEVMKDKLRVGTEYLRKTCAPETFAFTTTAELEGWRISSARSGPCRP